MTYHDAAEFRLGLGKYKGKTLDQIAETDEGLKYLDWLIDQDCLFAETKEAIEAYLDDPAIKKELKEL